MEGDDFRDILGPLVTARGVRLAAWLESVRIPESTQPGDIALTLTPLGPSTVARLRMTERSAEQALDLHGGFKRLARIEQRNP